MYRLDMSLSVCLFLSLTLFLFLSVFLSFDLCRESAVPDPA